jgi:hypothetical protein
MTRESTTTGLDASYRSDRAAGMGFTVLQVMAKEKST